MGRRLRCRPSPGRLRCEPECLRRARPAWRANSFDAVASRRRSPEHHHQSPQSGGSRSGDARSRRTLVIRPARRFGARDEHHWTRVEPRAGAGVRRAGRHVSRCAGEQRRASGARRHIDVHDRWGCCRFRTRQTDPGPAGERCFSHGPNRLRQHRQAPQSEHLSRLCGGVLRKHASRTIRRPRCSDSP